jgi:hypothetical protein
MRSTTVDTHTHIVYRTWYVLTVCVKSYMYCDVINDMMSCFVMTYGYMAPLVHCMPVCADMPWTKLFVSIWLAYRLAYSFIVNMMLVNTVYTLYWDREVTVYSLCACHYHNVNTLRLIMALRTNTYPYSEWPTVLARYSFQIVSFDEDESWTIIDVDVGPVCPAIVSTCPVHSNKRWAALLLEGAECVI